MFNVPNASGYIFSFRRQIQPFFYFSYFVRVYDKENIQMVNKENIQTKTRNMCSAWLFIIAALVKSDVIFLYIHCSWKLVDSFPFLLYLFHFSNVDQLSSVNENDTVIDVPVDENCQLTDRHPDPDERMSTMESWNPIPDTASKSSWLNNAAKRCCQFEMISWNTGILFVMHCGELTSHSFESRLKNPTKPLNRKSIDTMDTLEETLCRLIENVSICVIA